MTDREILVDLFQTLSNWVHGALDDIPAQALSWQPDEEANSIAMTMWHVSRAFDVLRVRVLENRPCEEEAWYVGGWAERTGYDPRGKGWGGFGNLGGYTLEEVKEVPVLPADDLLRYFDETCAAVCAGIEQMPEDALYQPAPGWAARPQTAHACIRNFLIDSAGHLGEARAIRAMWERRNRA